MKCICDKCGKDFQLRADADEADADAGTIETGVGGCSSDPYGYTAAYCPFCEHEHVLRGF